jgi:hypothetical protein
VRQDCHFRDLALDLPGLREAIYRLPPFALPHKRFVSEVVCDRSQVFLGTDQSYRGCVRSAGRELVYDGPPDNPFVRGAAALAPSTVWRWVSWLGDGLQVTFRKAQRLIHRREPRSTLHRQDWSVSPTKYRSDRRRQTLQRAMQGLVIRTIFQDLFGKAIFPNFATAAGWC